MIYNSPYYGFQTRAELFFDFGEATRTSSASRNSAAPRRSATPPNTSPGASPDISLLVGVDTQVFHGFVNCGAVGAITGIGNVLPKETLHLVSLCQRAAKGDPEARRLALELDGAFATLSAFDEGTDLVLYFKHLMVLQGDPEYALHFNESDALSDSQKRFAEAQLRLFKTGTPNGAARKGVRRARRRFPYRRRAHPAHHRRRAVVGPRPASERRGRFAEEFDHVRRFAILEPRGYDALIGALLCEPSTLPARRASSSSTTPAISGCAVTPRSAPP